MMRQSFIILVVVGTAFSFACSRQPNPPSPDNEAQLSQKSTASLAVTATSSGTTHPTQQDWSDEDITRFLNAQIAVLRLTLLDNQHLNAAAKQGDATALQMLAAFQQRYRETVAAYGYTTTAYEADIARIETNPQLKAQLLSLAADQLSINAPIEQLTPSQVRELLRRQQ